MKKILIAEDDYTSRRFMQKFISKYGDCFMASDGLEAIQLYRESLECKEYFDLVVLDIMMPNIDGTSVLRMIRDLDAEEGRDRYITNAVFLTALNDQGIVNMAKDMNVKIFNKPLNIEEFLKGTELEF